MFEELTLVRMATAMARHAGARHRVIAENVANADTPGYRAREVKGFAEYVNEGFNMRATRAAHFGAGGPERAATSPQIRFDMSTQASANGNSVSLENEMVKSTSAQGQHRLALTIYAKTQELMRLGLGRGR